MTKYHDILDQKFEAAGNVVIKGVPLDIGDDHPLRMRGYSPFLSPTCVCVTEPCPCDEHDDILVWLPESGIRSRKATKQKNGTGEYLHDISVMRDADIFTETLTRRKAAGFNPRASSIGPHRTKLSMSAFSGPSQVKFRNPSALRGTLTCGGDNVLYYVLEGPDGSGGTLFEYIAIGSCEATSS